MNRPVKRGTVLVCVLACLIVVSALAATTMQTVIRSRLEVRSQRLLRQTELLCEAGVLRAAQQLQKSPTYSGEQWLPRLDIAPYQRASVDIRLVPLAGSNSQRVQVVARLAAATDGYGELQRTHTFTIENFSPSTSPSTSENE